MPPSFSFTDRGEIHFCSLHSCSLHLGYAVTSFDGKRWARAESQCSKAQISYLRESKLG